MYFLRDALHVMDRAQHVRHMRARDEAGPFREQRIQVARLELGVSDIRRSPPLHDKLLTLGHGRPGIDVGLMIHFGEDDLVALVESERKRQVAEDLGGGGADDYLQSKIRPQFIMAALTRNVF